MWMVVEWATSNFKRRKGTRVEHARKCAILAKSHVSYSLTNLQIRRQQQRLFSLLSVWQSTFWEARDTCEHNSIYGVLWSPNDMEPTFRRRKYPYCSLTLNWNTDLDKVELNPIHVSAQKSTHIYVCFGLVDFAWFFCRVHMTMPFTCWACIYFSPFLPSKPGFEVKVTGRQCGVCLLHFNGLSITPPVHRKAPKKSFYKIWPHVTVQRWMVVLEPAIS